MIRRIGKLRNLGVCKKYTYGTLRKRMETDFVRLMREKNAMSGVLKQVVAEIVRVEKNGKGEISEEMEMSVVKRCSEKSREAIYEYGKLLEKHPNDSRIVDAIKRETEELSLVESYLPVPFTEAEIERIVRDTINTVRECENDKQKVTDKKLVLGSVLKMIKMNVDCNRLPSMSDLVKKVDESL